MLRSGRVEDERVFDDIREMMERNFSGEGVCCGRRPLCC